MYNIIYSNYNIIYTIILLLFYYIIVYIKLYQYMIYSYFYNVNVSHFCRVLILISRLRSLNNLIKM